MFDEPLTISQVIDKLNAMKEKYGDIKVGTWNNGIIKFIRSVVHLESTNTGNHACVLQWFDDTEDE